MSQGRVTILSQETLHMDSFPDHCNNKFFGKIPTSRKQMDERVQKYLRKKDGTESKEAYPMAGTSQWGRPKENHHHNQTKRGNKRWYFLRPYQRDERRYRRLDVLSNTEKPKETHNFPYKPPDRSKYCEFNK